MRKRALRIVAVFVPLISPSMVAPPGDLESFDDTVRSDVAGSVTVESSFTEAVSVPGVEGAGVENVDAAGAGGVIEVVEGPVGGFRVPGWQVRCKIGTGTAGRVSGFLCVRLLL